MTVAGTEAGQVERHKDMEERDQGDNHGEQHEAHLR